MGSMADSSSSKILNFWLELPFSNFLVLALPNLVTTIFKKQQGTRIGEKVQTLEVSSDIKCFDSNLFGFNQVDTIVDFYTLNNKI